MIAHPSGVFPHQAATTQNEETFEFDDNISDFLYQSLKPTIKSCETYDLSRLTQARSQDLEKGGGYFERVRSVQTTLTRIFIDLESVSDGLSEI